MLVTNPKKHLNISSDIKRLPPEITQNNSGNIKKQPNLFRIAFLISLCLAGAFFSYMNFRSEIAIELCFLALIIPALYYISCGFANINIALKSYRLALFYLIPLFFSFIFSINENTDLFRDLVMLMNLFLAFFLASLFGSRPEHDLPHLVMRQLTFLLIPLFIYVAITQQHAYIWGRWTPFGIQPNWWGMMSLGLAWCCFTWKNLWVRFVTLGLCLYFMVSVQSRGSIAAFLPVIFFASGWFYPLSKKNMLNLFVCLFLGFLLALAWGIYSEVSLLNKITDFLINDVMRMNDPNRGLNTGLTGRTEGYQMAWNGFIESPIFGNGFKEYSFVHNGFLLTLAESGIFAFIGMTYLFFTTIRSAIKGKRWSSMGYLLSYALALMTFPRSFNINMTGILLLIVMMAEISYRFIPRKRVKIV
jgi:hypothetical protein